MGDIQLKGDLIPYAKDIAKIVDQVGQIGGHLDKSNIFALVEFLVDERDRKNPVLTILNGLKGFPGEKCRLSAQQAEYYLQVIFYPVMNLPEEYFLFTHEG